MTLEELRGKSIAIVGMGVNNKKLADFFSANQITYDVFADWKSPSELSGKLSKYQIIFRTPGLPYLSGPVAEALKTGTIVYSQTRLFFDLCLAPIIGVTGTKGKGTTATLIAKILEVSGKKTWLAGNVGQDPFEFLAHVKPSDIVVLELSSFQLQDLIKSPKYAVVLDISQDHLNHHKDFDEYIAAKANIIKYQSPEDYAVLSKSLPESFINMTKAKKIFFDLNEVESFDRKLLGRHNLANIAATNALCQILGIDKIIIRNVVAQFEPLPHRLKIIWQTSGVTWVDDAYSTNVEPTMAAIDAFNQPIVLILGGFDKGIDFGELGKKIKNSTKIKSLIVVGQIANQILKAVEGFSGKILTGAANMEEIVAQAQSLAQAGDVVIFSPGTSSFDMFQNETDRGDQFVQQVLAL